MFFSYAIVTPTTVDIYVDDDKLTPEVKAHLGQDVVVKPYDSIFADAKAMMHVAETSGSREAVDGNAMHNEGATRMILSEA